MSKRKKIILSIAAICLIISVMVALSLSNQPSGTTKASDQTDNTSTETEPTEEPEGPLFVVPENTLGTLGLISALMTALGIFAIKNKKLKLC
jgi:hypothetical protein